MVHAFGTKIFPNVYVTEDMYKGVASRINDLAKQTNTEITFWFTQQYFEIKGRNQKGVDTVVMQLTTGLLPVWSTKIDEMKLLGTWQRVTLEEVQNAASSPESSRPTSAQPPSQPPPVASQPVIGRAPILDKSDDEDDVPVRQTTLMTIPRFESDDEEPVQEKFTEKFEIPRNIKSPQNLLIGLPLENMQPADYLSIISQHTHTECTLVDRTVHIEGDSETAVKDALSRFQVIHLEYKARNAETVVVPCVHYPTHSDHYGLYFCDLDRYAHSHFVDLYGGITRPLYVLLPVFRDPRTNEYLKPTDLLDVDARPVAIPSPHAMSLEQWYSYQQDPYDTHALNEAMRMASIHGNIPPSPRPLSSDVYQSSNPSPQQSRGYSSDYGSSPAPMPRGSPVSQQTKYPTNASTEQHPRRDEFPALPAKSSRMPSPSVADPQKPMSRRVLRLTPQKSANGQGRQPGLLEMAREYNLYNIKKALTDGLNLLRGFKGEIQLEAKLGKVLWTNLSPEVQKNIWEFSEINDIVVKEYKAKPVFNDVTTASEEIMTRMSEILPKPYKRIAYFEIHAEARNQPALRYKPVVIYMNQGVVEVQKVVVSKKKMVEIDWVSLDRKLDFQMALTAQQLTRPDVKPYTTFIKKVSVSPTTRELTYENVPDFLQVSYILHKQTTKYRIHFPFVVEITRIEKLPLRPQKTNGYGVEKILGMTGRGQVWYDLQVSYSSHKELFQSNLDLPVGKLAPWTVEDVLGRDNAPTYLVEYVKCLLLLVEKCQPCFRP